MFEHRIVMILSRPFSEDASKSSDGNVRSVRIRRGTHLVGSLRCEDWGGRKNRASLALKVFFLSDLVCVCVFRASTRSRKKFFAHARSSWTIYRSSARNWAAAAAEPNRGEELGPEKKSAWRISSLLPSRRRRPARLGLRKIFFEANGRWRLRSDRRRDVLF